MKNTYFKRTPPPSSLKIQIYFFLILLSVHQRVGEENKKPSWRIRQQILQVKSHHPKVTNFKFLL